MRIIVVKALAMVVILLGLVGLFYIILVSSQMTTGIVTILTLLSLSSICLGVVVRLLADHFEENRQDILATINGLRRKIEKN